MLWISHTFAIYVFSNRTAAAVSMHRCTVMKYLKKFDDDENVTTPGKSRPREKPKRGVDGFTMSAIRNLIYELHRKSTSYIFTQTTFMSAVGHLRPSNFNCCFSSEEHITLDSLLEMIK